jgi:hypothetical protein
MNRTERLLHSSHQDIVDLQNKLIDAVRKHWVQDDVFTAEWWFMLALLIVPWYIAWKWVDKSRIFEMGTHVLFIFVIAHTLDLIGGNLGLWYYPHRLFPLVAPMTLANYTVFPVTYTLIYQFFPKWKTYLFVLTAASAVFAFVGEPLFVWLEIYEPRGWKHIYSFPIYIAIGAAVKTLVGLLKKKQNL